MPSWLQTSSLENIINISNGKSVELIGATAISRLIIYLSISKAFITVVTFIILNLMLSYLSDLFKKIDFDLKTFIYTLLLIPMFLVIKRIVIKYVKDWTEYLVDGLMYFLSRYIKQSLAASLSMRRYCKLQLGNESIKYLYIPSTLDINLDIDKIFVNLTISYIDEEECEFNHTDFLKIGNRIKVMGDPGSGKSSLIKRVFRSTCTSGLKRPRKTKLPIFIELKNINPESINLNEVRTWLYRYIKDEISKNKVYKMDECFENYASNWGILLLLDGLDEVSSSHYKTFVKCINELSSYLTELSTENVIVLTMRTQFYQQVKGDYTNSFPHATFLKPFTPSDIYEFLSRWHFNKNADSNISRVYRDLTDRPTLREMCSNPLVLSMYVAEDQTSKGNVSPESRTQFYRKITEELIIKRRLMQKSSIPGSYSSLKEQREKILGRIAYNHLINIDEPRNTLSWKSAIQIIMDILFCDEIKADEVFNELAKETGLITEERYQESFRFIHLTFCEFLAAFEVVQGVEDGWSQLLGVHNKFMTTSNDGKSRLIEVIPFTAGLLPRIKRETALHDVADLNDNTLSSRCFLETKLYNHGTWGKFIRSSRKDLLNGMTTKFDEKWLQDLHMFNVVVRDAQLASENIVIDEKIDLNEFYENLLDNEKASLGQILSAFANQDAAAVFRLAEMANINLLEDFPNIIIQNCDQPPFLGLVRDKIIQLGQDCENWAALLIESALQKKIVSHNLNEMNIVKSLDAKILSNKNYKLWYVGDFAISKTFYTQCCSLASTSNLKHEQIKSLPLLMSLKSPNQVRFRFLFSYYLSGSLTVFTIISLIYLGNKIGFHNVFARIPKQASQSINYPTLCIGTALYGTMIYSLSLRISNIRFFKSVLNVGYVNSESSDKSIGFLMKIIMTNPAFILSSIIIGKKDKQILKELKRIRGNDE
jgi:hypothetical protein